MSQPLRQVFTCPVSDNPLGLVELLQQQSGLTKQAIKSAIAKGALWLERGKHTRRLRRVKTVLKPGDVLHFYYDPVVLQQTTDEAVLIDDQVEYSLWFKPYGMLCQGSKWSDHCTIARWAEQQLIPQRPAFIVHRIDRATSGLVLIAHSKKAVKALTALFENRNIEKRYRAIVHGDHRLRPQPDTLTETIDNKSACSHVTCLQVDDERGLSLVEVTIETGRKHQIRKHLSAISFPIVGDRLYGLHTALDEQYDLQLSAYYLRFVCPFSQRVRNYKLPDNYCLKL